MAFPMNQNETSPLLMLLEQAWKQPISPLSLESKSVEKSKFTSKEWTYS